MASVKLARSIFSFSGSASFKCVESFKPRQVYWCNGIANYSSKAKQSKSNKVPILIGVTMGITIGAGYSYFKMNEPRTGLAVLNPGMGKKCSMLSELPNVKVSREVNNPADTSGLKVTLFQYTTCPFCCKVRAFLDFYGISYDVIEVNPVLRQQLKWSDYRKVPIVLIKTDEGYLQLNDSSMIISVLTSYLLDKEQGIRKVSDFYPTIEYQDDDGTLKKEILNRYFLMYHGNFPNGVTKESIDAERKWRQWADNVLVHTLSPNVYRTRDEALQAFRWFSDIGEWEKHFAAWERNLVIYVGALAMWGIGKRLKKKHHLKEDVRESLYDDCNQWLRELKKLGTEFHGGESPDLADLAVFGVLSSIEGCTAFSDALARTKIASWYNAVKHRVSSRAGSAPVLAATYT